MAAAALAGVAGSREFWHLSLAFPGDAGAGLALPGPVEHACDQPAGPSHLAAGHSGLGCAELLPDRETFNGLGKKIRLKAR